MRAKNRIRNRKGFTLAETLLAVLILLLVSSIVAAGVPAARQAYEKVVLASNAELMLSTAVATLRDELGTAWDVQQVTGGVTYFSADTTNRSKLYVESGTIKLYEYSETTDAEKLLRITKKAESGRELVYHAKDDTALKLVCDNDGISLDADHGIVKVTGLCVKNGDSVVAQWGGKTAADLVIPVFSTRDED